MKHGFPRALIIPFCRDWGASCLSSSCLVSNSGPLKEGSALGCYFRRSLSGREPAGWNYVRVSSKRRNDQIGDLNVKALRWYVLHSHPHDNDRSQRMCRVGRAVVNVMGRCQTGWQHDAVVKSTISKGKNGALPERFKIGTWFDAYISDKSFNLKG